MQLLRLVPVLIGLAQIRAFVMCCYEKLFPIENIDMLKKLVLTSPKPQVRFQASSFSTARVKLCSSSLLERFQNQDDLKNLFESWMPPY